VTITLSLKK